MKTFLYKSIQKGLWQTRAVEALKEPNISESLLQLRKNKQTNKQGLGLVLTFLQHSHAMEDEIVRR